MTSAATSTGASPLSPALLLDEAADSVTNVVVHPLVLLHVLDHHSRRQEASGRVIGTLLGHRNGRTVEVTNCFAVPHAERGDEVAIGKDFNKQMLALHMKIDRKEQVVGWYASAALGEDDESTPELIADTSSLIHEFYAGESDEGDPVHLVVDTRLKENAISARAYKSTPVLVQGEPLANLFHELTLKMQSANHESLCMDKMLKGGAINGKSEGQPEPLLVSMEKLYSLLEAASNYVDSVVEGNVAPDAELGRQIANTLSTVPRIRPEVFDKLFNDALQDLLMVTYLNNITRTQLTIAEKLNATLGV
eukprot:Nitzschia sp. Nitz4//scaffold3_size479765//218740//219739//NITZ4_000093-RA/size479765-augustus-gene-1.598-mRNA-1//-1//CDS//3329550737//8422//frame0